MIPYSQYLTGLIRNDSVIGDPLFTVPIHTSNLDRVSLCYEIHGRGNTFFNLVSDKCTNINAHYLSVGRLNIVDSIGVSAEGNDGMCRHVRVDLAQCAVSVMDEGGAMVALNASEEFSMGGVHIRQYRDRVRIAVPNCDQVTLVAWVVCERGEVDMIRFNIARGVNLRPTSHGLLGECLSLLHFCYKTLSY